MTVAVREYDSRQDFAPTRSRRCLVSAGTNVAKADRAPTQVVYLDDVVVEDKGEVWGAATRNWISRLNQIKAEIVNLPERIPREGLVNPTEAALGRLNYLVSALAGSREPIFEVDHDDGEISILWSDAEQKHSVSINLDASAVVRVVCYKAGAAVQPPVHRLSLNNAVDAVAIQQVLASDGYREVVTG